MAGMKLLEKGKATLEICGRHRVTFAEGKECPGCKEDKREGREILRAYKLEHGIKRISTLKTCPAGRTVGA